MSVVSNRTGYSITTQTKSESLKTRPRPIELQTENGFCIVRRCEMDEGTPVGGTEHCFVVRDPYGYELDITVNFTDESVAELIRHSRGRLTLKSVFWLACAEHHLSDYLAEREDYPPDAKITIDYVTPDDADLARRWGADISPQQDLARFRATATTTDGNGARAKPQPITFLTENGYGLVRLSDLDSAVNDSPDECHFRVTNPNGLEREITVRFDPALVQEIQRRRRRGELAVASKYWPVIAEKYLGDYLWRQNTFPPNGEFTINQLSGDDLLLAAHWQEQEK